MKQERGVTTTSLIIYVIAMLIVIGIIATITSFFYTNVMNLQDNSDNISELTKFNMYFLEEVKNKENDIVTISENSITFLTGNTYTFQDNSIYLNSSKICENIKDVKFSIENVNEKTIINVLITIGENLEYTKTTQYVLKRELPNGQSTPNNSNILNNVL